MGFEYKVGDRVIATDNLGRNKKKPGTIVKLWYTSNHPTPYGVDFDDDICSMLWSEVHSIIPTEQKIVITHDGKTTTATMYEENKKVKTATAKCAPEDTFDFNTGAEIAFNRLVGKPCGEEAPKPKYYNGKVVCIKSGYDWWTVGKVYEVKDGVITANDGYTYPPDCYERYKTLDEVRHAGCYNGKPSNPRNEFIPLVEN